MLKAISWGREDSDGLGYSVDEMDMYANKVGFKLVKNYQVFSKIPIINTSTVYLVNKVKEVWVLKLLDKLPFSKNNNVRIYLK